MSYLLIGLAGMSVTDLERDWLARPEVGGLTLFSRNIADVVQLQELVSEIRSIDPAALICIDQEGGRVQRIKEPCTLLPPLAALGELYVRNEDDGLDLAHTHGWLMANEMRALGIDQSFAPVLDLNCGSEVIGDRAFAAEPNQVKELARAYLRGMHQAGMAAVGKHYPGHGSITPDTHVADALDQRCFEDIAISDLRPFTVAIKHGLDGVMMAHVCYPQVCAEPAGYSPIWIKEILRQRTGFNGVVFSDDLGMRAAETAGNYQQRLEVALDAGCDFALVCRPADVAELFADAASWPAVPEDDPRNHLRQHGGIAQPDWSTFCNSDERAEAQEKLMELRSDG